jgi:hypothetical protein
LIGHTTAKPEPVGYVLARMTDDKSGRPISFVFAGKTSLTDGSEVKLTPAILKASVNYKQVRDGYAYPLYYNTLFADLRNEFNIKRCGPQATAAHVCSLADGFRRYVGG